MTGFSNIADLSSKLLRFWGGNQASGSTLQAQGAGRTPTFAPGGSNAGLGVGVSGAASIPGTGVATAAVFDTEVFDDANFFDIGTPTLLTIPAGITRIVLSATCFFGANVTGLRNIFTEKNGSSGAFGSIQQRVDAITSSVTNTTLTGARVIDCVAGDEFGLEIVQDSGVSLTCFFQMSLVALR